MLTAGAEWELGTPSQFYLKINAIELALNIRLTADMQTFTQIDRLTAACSARPIVCMGLVLLIDRQQEVIIDGNGKISHLLLKPKRWTYKKSKKK